MEPEAGAEPENLLRTFHEFPTPPLSVVWIGNDKAFLPETHLGVCSNENGAVVKIAHRDSWTKNTAGAWVKIIEDPA